MNRLSLDLDRQSHWWKAEEVEITLSMEFPLIQALEILEFAPVNGWLAQALI